MKATHIKKQVASKTLFILNKKIRLRQLASSIQFNTQDY